MSLNNFYFIIAFVSLFAVMLILQTFRTRFVKAEKIQVMVLLLFSYLFICYSDIRFGVCVAIVTALAYIVGLLLDKNSSKRRLILTIGIISCVLILAYFKYCNFFINSFAGLLGGDVVTIDIILPLGISFYIFTALSYMIDVYRKKYAAENNVLKFALFIAFFPKITAGPIIRGDEFLSQVRNYQGANCNSKLQQSAKILNRQKSSEL